MFRALLVHDQGSQNCTELLLNCINNIQQDATYAGIYLLQVYSICFGRPSRPSSGVQKSVTSASGTGRIT